MRSMRGSYLAAACIALALLTSCHTDDEEGEGPAELRLPMYFQLNATASATEGELTVNCSLGFIVDISGEVSRTSEVVEYIAVMGGDAVRDIQREDGSGVVLSAFAHYPNLQVLHILPDRVQLVSLDFPPGGPSTGSRFWDELRFFDGVLEEDGTINGEWLCAPLDVEQGGINDNSIFAEGTWTTTELPR
jgi:hypothetical protein